jgi:hypothetical protein
MPARDDAGGTARGVYHGCTRLVLNSAIEVLPSEADIGAFIAGWTDPSPTVPLIPGKVTH